MAIDTGALRKELEEKKLILDEKYAIAEVAARKVVERYKELLVAEENRDFKNGSKEIARHEVAEEAFSLSVKDYFRFAGIYSSLLEEVLSLYEKLIDSECVKGAKKARAEAKRFEERENYRKGRLENIVAKVSGVNEAYADYISDISEQQSGEEKTDEDFSFKDIEDEWSESAFQAEPEQLYEPAELPRRDATANAVNVDITAIIENAVASAMDKFNAVLEARTNKILNESAPTAAVNAQTSEESENIFKLHSGLVDFELEIAAKLSVLTEKLKALSEDLIKIGVSCIELSNTQKETLKKQSEIADMQAALLKSAEEVAEKQILTSENYSAALQEQTALLEKQKASASAQAFIGDGQSELETLQKSILEAQTTLAQTSGEIFESQKQIIEMQKNVTSAQAKNLEQQRALTEKQSEISELQKTAFSEHKQLKKKLKKK